MISQDSRRSGRGSLRNGMLVIGFLTALLALATACGPSQAELEQVVSRYIEAVQALDSRRLAGVSAAGPAPEEEGGPAAPGVAGDWLKARLDQRLDDYLEQRAGGFLYFAPDGMVLVRALGLGRGTYYETVAVERQGAGRVRLVQEVRLAYRSIDLSRLPPGTTIYLMGAPLGTIYMPVIGEGEAAVRTLLERIWLDWELVREEDGWKVLSVAPSTRPAEAYDETRRY